MHPPSPNISTRPRRLPGRRLLLAAAAAGALAGVLGWALAPQAVERAVVTVQPPPGWGGSASPFSPAITPRPAAPASALRSMPVPVPLPPQPAPSTPLSAPLSTQVAPGVHLTPMGLPPGAVPLPAGPQPHDSEPEN